MTLVRHILAKDFRLLRWLIGVWIALSLVDTLDRVVAPRLMASSDRWQILPMWLLNISVAYALVLVRFVANHIQAERLVGTTAFWLTRPIPRDTLLRSKLLGLFLFIALPTLVIEAMSMAAFQVPVTGLVLALIQQTWAMTILLLVLAFCATLTATATRLLFLIVGGFVALFTLLLTLLFMSPTGQVGSGPWPPDRPGDASAVFIGFTIFAIGVLVAIRHHYQRRRRVIAVLIFAASVVLAGVVQSFWPRVALFGAEPTLAQEAWARDASVSRLRLGTRNRMIADFWDGSFGRIQPRRMKSVAAPVFIEGLPSDYTATPYTTAAQVRFADDRTIESERHSPTMALVPNTLDISTPGPNDQVSREFWPTLMVVPSDVFSRDGDRPGVYRGTFDYTIERHATLAVMPLRVGAAYKDGPRSLLVTGLRYQSERCTVTVRTSSVNLITESLLRPQLVPRFQHHGLVLRHAAMGSYQGGAGGVSNVGLGGFFIAAAPRLAQQLDIGYRVAQPLYPIFDEQHATGPPCDEIDIAFERTTYAGSLTRTLELRDFYLNAPHGQARASRE